MFRGKYKPTYTTDLSRQDFKLITLSLTRRLKHHEDIEAANELGKEMLLDLRRQLLEHKASLDRAIELTKEDEEKCSPVPVEPQKQH